jgi:site-specific recombinase XerD
MARQTRQFPQGKYVLRTPHDTKDGQVYAVYLYYFWKGKQIRKSVDLFTTQKDWNQDANGGAGEFRSSYGPNYKERNAYLRELMHDIDSKIMDFIKQHGEIDGDTIEAFVSGDDKALRADNGIDFVEFSKQRFIDRYNSGKIGVSSRENGVSYINQFAKFLKQEHRGSHGEHQELLYIGEITEQLVLDFRNWQLGNDRKVDTVNKVVQTIGGICQYASQMRYVPIEVTLAIKDLHLSDKSLDADEVRVKYLTEEQLKEFAGIRETLPHIRMKEFHDMFMFSFYACGLRLIDMMTLRWVDIDLKKRVIRKIQVKTRNRNVIPIREAAIEILDRWKGRYKVFVFGLLPESFDLNNDELLRKRRNSVTNTINTSLKRQSKFANFEFEVTFHWARHTWAVLALEKGVEISKISRLLGHTSTAVTEKIYAEYLPDTLGEVVDELNFSF